MADNSVCDIASPVNAGHLLAEAIRKGVSKPPRSFRDWLLNEFTLPDGPHKNKRFKFEYQPITKLWVDEIDSGRWVEHIFTGPSQSGKSLSGYVAPLLYHATELGEKVVFAVPIDEMAVDKWEDDIRPTMEASPRMRRLLPKRGPGSGGGTIRDRVILSSGVILKIMAAGGSDQSKAGFTARVLCATEAAAFGESTSSSVEGDPLRQLLARLRAETRDRRRIFIEGTNATEEMLPATLRQHSTDSKIYVQCPSCGKWICPTREDLKGWQDAKNEIEAKNNAYWQCHACEEPFTEQERFEALSNARLVHRGQSIDKKGNVVGDPPPTSRLYFQYIAFHNVFLSAGDIAYDCWAAAQIEPDTPNREKADRALSQFVFGTTYEPPAHQETDEVRADKVEDRRLDIPRGIAPSDTRRVVLGADIGERWVHWSLLAVRECQAIHVIDYGMEEIPIKSVSLREAIRKAVLDVVNQHAKGIAKEGSEIPLPLWAAYIDSGFQPDSIFDAVKMVDDKMIEFLPVLGRGENQFRGRKYTQPARTGNIVRELDRDGRWYLSRVKRAGLDQLTCDTESLKLLMLNGLVLPLSTAGSISLFAGPRSIHKKYAKQLTANQLITVEIPGKPPKSEWEKNGPDHYGDSMVYALVAALRHGWSPEQDQVEQDQEASEWSTS